jgi:hypothetical protein
MAPQNKAKVSKKFRFLVALDSKDSKEGMLIPKGQKGTRVGTVLFQS